MDIPMEQCMIPIVVMMAIVEAGARTISTTITMMRWEVKTTITIAPIFMIKCS